MRVHVTENILWLDVSVANTLGVNIGYGPHELVRVKLDNKVWHLLLHFVELLHYSISGVGDVIHHDVEVNFVWFISICVEALPHLDTVGVMEHLKDG